MDQFVNNTTVADHVMGAMPFMKHSPLVAAVFTAFYVVIFVLGVTGNLLVCVVVIKDRSMRTVTNYFIVNLAVSDLLVMLICLPVTLWIVCVFVLVPHWGLTVSDMLVCLPVTLVVTHSLSVGCVRIGVHVCVRAFVRMAFSTKDRLRIVFSTKDRCVYLCVAWMAFSTKDSLFTYVWVVFKKKNALLGRQGHRDEPPVIPRHNTHP
ncbi:Neuropeptide FF receptor 2 [Branchiostoma belcheri]|nr:Neuropeptide FF receptor 2 [Branchiostoma belcheri]